MLNTAPFIGSNPKNAAKLRFAQKESQRLSGQTSQNETSGQRRRESVLTYNFRVARNPLVTPE
jgi:hypothetical protein